MPNYNVMIREVYVSTRTVVEADTPEQAIELASEVGEEDLEYSHTLGKETWTIEEVDTEGKFVKAVEVK